MDRTDVGALLKQVHDKMKAMGDAAFKKQGITFSQLNVMKFVSMQGGQTTQKEIEEYLGVAHPTVVGLVARLEKGGFLSCRRDETNRRNKLVCITRKACDMERELSEGRRKAEENLLRGLSDDEVRELTRLLAILNGNLDCRINEEAADEMPCDRER